jgi:hypothetical protein
VNDPGDSTGELLCNLRVNSEPGEGEIAAQRPETGPVKTGPARTKRVDKRLETALDIGVITPPDEQVDRSFLMAGEKAREHLAPKESGGSCEENCILFARV